MRKYLFVTLFATVICPGLAQCAPPPDSPSTGAAQPAAVAPTMSGGATTAAPTGYGTTAAPNYLDDAAPVRPGPGSSGPFLSKADHLRVAAEHLKAAGRDEEARRVRLMEAEERSRPENAIIRVDLRMIEISLTKLAEVSAARYGGLKDESALDLLTKLNSANKLPGSENQFASPNPKLIALIESLLKDHLAIPRAEPTFMMTSGRPAYIHEGGEVGYRVKDSQGKDSVEFIEYGIRADVLASLLPGNRIQLDALVKLSDLQPAKADPAGEYIVPERIAVAIAGLLTANTVPAGGYMVPERIAAAVAELSNADVGPADEYAVPVLKSRAIETGMRLRSGEMAIVGGAIEDRIETFVLMKAKIVTKDATTETTTAR
jgi:Flp pilus assembly secretin CpaC